MRLFLAIAIPHSLLSQLKKLQPCADNGVNLTRPENMHITLIFFGDEDLTKIESVLAHFHAKHLRIKQEGLGEFQNGSRSVLWAGLTPSPPLFYLRENLAALLERRGINFHKDQWQPHITLARCNTAKHKALREKFLMQPTKVSSAFEAEELILFNSEIEEGITHYNVVARFPLQPHLAEGSSG